MKKTVLINNRKINYCVRRSKKARNLRINVYLDGNVVATLPYRLEEFLIDNFVLEKSNWILEKLGKIKNERSEKKLLTRFSRKEYKENKKRALDFVMKRIKYFAEIYGFDFGKISIRNQRTRWGSCSKKGNLSFNYKLVFLPEKLADYIVVHEICHIGEFNHSKRFWNLVAKTFPDWKEAEKSLRKV